MIVNAIATSIIVAIVSGVILQQSLTSIKTLRLPRIKASMTAIEGSLRYMLLEASNYTGCNADAATGFTTCAFNGNVGSLVDIIPGCVNATNTACGVIVTPLGAGWNAATRTYTANIVYQGNEFAVKPKEVVVIVPKEILTQANVNCPPAGQPDKILFKGFDNSGQKICDEIPGNAAGCAAGSYLNGFDPFTLAIQCTAISAAPIDCSPTAVPPPATPGMVESVSFNGTSFTTTCKARQTPSTAGWPIAP